MVKRVVEAHQGAVEAESAKITRFSVFLPAYPVRQEAKKGTVNQ
jgi:nitrogen-specific signal transduction histidine kinase